MARKRTLGKKRKSRKLKKSHNNKRRNTYRKMRKLRGGGGNIDDALAYIKHGTPFTGSTYYIDGLKEHKEAFDKLARMQLNDEELEKAVGNIFYPPSPFSYSNMPYGSSTYIAPSNPPTSEQIRAAYEGSQGIGR